MKHNQGIITFLFIIFIYCISSFAQQQDDRQLIFKKYEEKYDVVDTARMEVVYIHSMFDPILKRKEIVYEMLLLGESHSRYIPYTDFLYDSICNSRAGEKYWENEFYKEHRKHIVMYGNSLERILKNIKDSTLRFTGFIMGDTYYYDELVHQMEWKIEDETKVVMGHQCQKATATWRGREWTAWFSDIPYSNGPWKFGGLPGLILEMSDSTGEHKIRAKGVKHEAIPLGMWKKRNYFRSKRERYKTMLEQVVENAAKMLMESGMVTGGLEDAVKKPRRRFYCPIELE